jgi:hypothetical protein
MFYPKNYFRFKDRQVESTRRKMAFQRVKLEHGPLYLSQTKYYLSTIDKENII